jgi:hypothetical protein
MMVTPCHVSCSNLKTKEALENFRLFRFIVSPVLNWVAPCYNGFSGHKIICGDSPTSLPQITLGLLFHTPLALC